MSLQDHIQHIRKLGNTKLSCGRDLMDLMTYKGITFWHFFLFRIFTAILKLDSSNQAFHLSKKEECALKSYSFLSLSNDIAAFFLCEIVLFLYQGRRFAKKPFKIVFVAQDLTWREVFINGKKKKTDSFFGSIVEALNARGDIQLVGTFPASLSIESFRVLIDKLRNWEIPQIPFNIFYSIGVWRDESECSRHFSKLWPRISEDGVFKELLSYKDMGRQEADRRFEYYFKVVISHIFKYIKMAEIMIDIEKPDMILVLNEYSDFEKSLVIAAKAKGIPTIALQHGIITPYHIGYMYPEEDRGKVILPDITCVYGKYYYDLLTKESIYSPEQVIITGQPRYDILHDAGKLYSREDFLRRLNIKAGNKIILWATQSHGSSDEENILYFNSVFRALEGMPGVTLIIKPHPGEGERYADMARSCAENYDIDMRQTDKLSDTFEQLYMCDLLITLASTTAIEAVALNKPVLIINYSEYEYIDYIEQGIALGVHKDEELRPAIERLLKDDSELAKNRERYIGKYLYKIDGKATERIVDIALKMLNDRRSSDQSE